MSEANLTEDDREHIRRLQALRESGTHNMFTEVKDGLTTYYGREEGNATYQWVTDNFEFYVSGEWRDMDV